MAAVPPDVVADTEDHRHRGDAGRIAYTGAYTLLAKALTARVGTTPPRTAGARSTTLNGGA
jgi:hypothetical protein